MIAQAVSEVISDNFELTKEDVADCKLWSFQVLNLVPQSSVHLTNRFVFIYATGFITWAIEVSAVFQRKSGCFRFMILICVHKYLVMK